MDRIPTFDVVDENEGWVGGMLAVIMVELRPTAWMVVWMKSGLGCLIVWSTYISGRF